MTLVRWRPTRNLLNTNRDFDNLFSDFFGNNFIRRYEKSWYPNIDISESDKEYIVKAELPGVDKDNVKISLQENVLTLQGDKNQEKEELSAKVHKCAGNIYLLTFHLSRMLCCTRYDSIFFQYTYICMHARCKMWQARDDAMSNLY